MRHLVLLVAQHPPHRHHDAQGQQQTHRGGERFASV